MTTGDPVPHGRQRVIETLHLLAAALAAVVIAIASQGWPASEATCERGNVCIADAEEAL